MSDDYTMGEVFGSMRKASQAKREVNRENSPKILREAGIPFATLNGGSHLIVQTLKKKDVDFWPGTGKWIPRGSKIMHPTSFSSRGVFPLIEYCKVN
jgi:hypothetical protein